jgi:hypothetical protein
MGAASESLHKMLQMPILLDHMPFCRSLLRMEKKLLQKSHSLTLLEIKEVLIIWIKANKPKSMAQR